MAWGFWPPKGTNFGLFPRRLKLPTTELGHSIYFPVVLCNFGHHPPPILSLLTILVLFKTAMYVWQGNIVNSSYIVDEIFRSKISLHKSQKFLTKNFADKTGIKIRRRIVALTISTSQAHPQLSGSTWITQIGLVEPEIRPFQYDPFYTSSHRWLHW
jgi:hypothetical protein